MDSARKLALGVHIATIVTLVSVALFTAKLIGYNIAPAVMAFGVVAIAKTISLLKEKNPCFKETSEGTYRNKVSEEKDLERGLGRDEQEKSRTSLNEMTKDLEKDGSSDPKDTIDPKDTKGNNTKEEMLLE